MNQPKKIASFALASLAFASCSGLSETIDNIKQQAEEIISQINVDPESLQKLMGNASRGMKIAGNRMGANFQASGVGEGGGSTPPPSAPAAPSFRAFAEETANFIEECATINASQGDNGTITVIEGFENCTGKGGQVKSTMSFGDAQINFKLDFTEFSEGVVGTDDYSFVDGSMSWQASRLYDDAGIVMLSNNGYTTRFSDDTTIAVAETIALEFIMDKESGDGALTIKGTSTASDGVSSATLFFDDVVFDPSVCPRGPSEGEIILSQNDNYVKVTISSCGEAVQITKNSTTGGDLSQDLTAAQLEAFFADFIANVGAFFEIINGTVSKGVAAIDNGQQLDDCSSDINNLPGSVASELEPYLGNWCAAWPADYNKTGASDYAWIDCTRICSRPNTFAPDVFRFGGIALIGNAQIDEMNGNYLVGAVNLQCRDEFPWNHGIVNYLGSATAVNYFADYTYDQTSWYPQGGSYDVVDFMYDDQYTDTFLLQSMQGSYSQIWRDQGSSFTEVSGGYDIHNGYSGLPVGDGYYVAQQNVYSGSQFYALTGNVDVCTYEQYNARDEAMGYAQ